MRLTVSASYGRMFSRGFAGRLNGTALRRSLRIFGQDIRKMMRRSIKLARVGKDGRVKSSRPGEPPRYRKSPSVTSKEQSKFAGGRYMIYVYDQQRNSVVIGPILWQAKRKPVPSVLEYGGSSSISAKAMSRQRVRKVGQIGEIRVGGVLGRRDAKGRFLPAARGMKLVKGTNFGTVPVSYARLKTQEQADRATELNAQLFGRPGKAAPKDGERRKVRLKARPYSRRALNAYLASGKPQKVVTSLVNKEIARLSGALKKGRP